MDFEWDEEKRRSNLAKHAVDFRDGVNIFLGNVLERIDHRSDYGELRVIATGKVDDAILTLVYTARGNYRRIISARRAHRNERREYRARFPLRSTSTGED
jgi:uncharacterized protein